MAKDQVQFDDITDRAPLFDEMVRSIHEADRSTKACLASGGKLEVRGEAGKRLVRALSYVDEEAKITPEQIAFLLERQK